MSKLPFPPGRHPGRRAHDLLLEGRRHGLKALDLLMKIDLTDAQRAELLETEAGVRLVLDEIASHLASQDRPE